MRCIKMVAVLLLMSVLAGCTGLVSQEHIPLESEHEPMGSDELLSEGKYEPARSEHDIGTCRTLAKDVAVIVLFTDDDASAWDEASMRTVQQDVENAIALVRDTAASYGVELTLPIYSYSSDEKRTIRYSGVVDTGGAKLDALASIAANWNYASKQELHAALQDYTGMEQLAYMVITNKSGYCYAQALTHRSPADEWCVPEYCVVAAKTANGSSRFGGTYLHEFLHLFGAQDFYRKEIGGTIYNESRSAEAARLCPGAIMLGGNMDIAQAEISGFTAYCVGWIDFLPSNYDTREWWAGSQWESGYLPGSTLY